MKGVRRSEEKEDGRVGGREIASTGPPMDTDLQGDQK